MPRKFEVLTQEQVDFFMENGFVVIKQAFTKEQAADWTKNVWSRLGMDPNDKSTWTSEKIHMPQHNRVRISEFAPKAWGAMKDLLGGEERIAIEEKSGHWADNFIINLGAPEYENDQVIDPHTFQNWHVDGDWFHHFLDSPEQAMLVTPIWSDIKPRGGGTYICPEGIPKIARYLAAHPEGVLPIGCAFKPATSTAAEDTQDPAYISTLAVGASCERFVEMLGETGDVVLMHPLMLHSASKNHTRVPRIITNPAVSLVEPFNFDREDPDDYSLVERKTLQVLGVDRLPFEITHPRGRVVPKRVQIQAKMLEDEKKRLAALAELAARKADVGVGSVSQAISVA